MAYSFFNPSPESIKDIMTHRRKLKFWYYEKSFIFRILFSAKSLRIKFYFVWYPYVVISGHLKIPDFENFWIKYRKIFKKYFKFFLVKNYPECHPRIFDTALRLYFGLDRQGSAQDLKISVRSWGRPISKFSVLGQVSVLRPKLKISVLG